MRDKKVKITVLLNPAEFERFDAYCTERGFKKSTLIARLIRDHLTQSGFRTQLELQLAAAERQPDRYGTRR